MLAPWRMGGPKAHWSVRSGPSRQGIAVVACLQVAVVCATTCLPALHRAFATHAHVFCAQHQVFEDVQPRGLSRPATTPTHDRGMTDESGREDRAHLACAFSNLILDSFDPPTAVPTSLARVAARAGRQPLSPVHVEQLPVLRLAPKHSPPT